ncbi:MAG TPA: DUF480 domain-containing protein, partial [Planctomycetota bacterium]|nr:DUF480 domain-containing protein [Planctomycetota bacterium]
SYATPEQYPLTLNALVVGSNQKSCRDPLMSLGEEEILDALDALREHRLVSLVRTAGGRADRYRHLVGDAWGITGKEAAVIAELLLRGPQTDGELRQRASRMVPIESLPDLAAIIEKLETREDPLVRRLSPPGRKRGAKYAHTLYAPGKEPALEEDGPEDDEASSDSEPGTTRGGRSGVREEVEALRAEVEAMRAEIEALRQRLEALEAGVGD